MSQKRLYSIQLRSVSSVGVHALSLQHVLQIPRPLHGQVIVVVSDSV